MKVRLLGILLCLFFNAITGFAQENFDRSTYYKAMSGGDLNRVEHELELLKGTKLEHKEGFEGALMMKKAGLSQSLKDKYHFFKNGHKKLEDAIEKDSNNIELRFLRVIIQEKAPKFLKYNTDLEKDKKLMIDSFKSASPALKSFILDYTKTSKVLNSKDFQ